MQKKIIDAGEDLLKKCLAIDCSFMLSGRDDPKFTESLRAFIATLNEAEEKRMFGSLKLALKKLAGED